MKPNTAASFFASSLTRRIVTVLGGMGVAAPLYAQTTYDWAGTTAGSWEVDTNWTPNALASTFTNLDTAQLVQDFTAATWTLDSQVTINKLIYEDTGATADIIGIIDSGIGGPLIFDGTLPSIETRNSVTINADLAGSAGLTKTGPLGLTLTGNNAALSGTMTIADPGAFNTGGVFISNLAALGGITDVTTQGTPTTGGFFRLNGTGIVVPSSVTFNLSGQGGNSAPNGTLVGSGTGINEIQGTINILTGGVRISNALATRLDISGQITGSFPVIFRLAQNEGVHLTNTTNNWTGSTTHSGGVLWFEPGTLPGGNLVIAASDAGSIQTSGSFTRSLGTAAGEAVSQYVQAGNREGGFSARGSDLTVNIGGAGADLKFYDFRSLTGTRTLGSNTITAFASTTGYNVGMVVSGTGIPTNSTITFVNPTSLIISTNATAAGSTAVTGSTTNSARWQTNTLNLNWDHADSKLTFVNGLDLNGSNRTISVRANIAEIQGVIRDTHATVVGTGITKTGINGTLLLATSHTFTGNVNINQGRLQITRVEALGLQNGVADKTITTSNGTAGNPQLALDGSGGDIDLPSWMVHSTSNNTRASILNLAGNNTVRGNVTLTTGGGGTQVQSDAGKLTFTGNFTPSATSRDLKIAGAGDIEISGVIADGTTVNMPVRKFGTGTVTLSGNNTYTGTTSLEGGLTLVNGSLALSATTVKATATLGGSGTIGGDVTLEDGATISPGNSPGALTVGGLDASGSATLKIELNGTSAQSEYDQLCISAAGGGSGTVDIADSVLDLALGFTPAPGAKFLILLNDGDDGIAGQLSHGAVALQEGEVFSAAGRNWRISYQDNGDGGIVSNDISLTAVP